VGIDQIFLPRAEIDQSHHIMSRHIMIFLLMVGIDQIFLPRVEIDQSRHVTTHNDLPAE
jgi:hypothetical protein